MSLSKVEQEVSVFSNPSIYSHMASRSFSVGSLDVLPMGSPRYSGLASGVGERLNGPSWSALACSAGTIIDPSHTNGTGGRWRVNEQDDPRVRNKEPPRRLSRARAQSFIILLFSYLRSSDLEFLSVQFLVFVLRSKRAPRLGRGTC